MSRLALPDHQQQAVSMAEQVKFMRFQAATEIMGHLVGLEFMTAQREAVNERERLGDGCGDEESEEHVKLNINVGRAAGLSVAAANALLITLGVMQPPAKPSIQAGPR